MLWTLAILHNIVSTPLNKLCCPISMHYAVLVDALTDNSNESVYSSFTKQCCT